MACGSIVWWYIQFVSGIHFGLWIFCDDCLHHGAKLIGQPVFACRPPFSYAGIGKVVAHRPFDSAPERLLQRAVPIIEEHSLAVSDEPGEEGAKSELGDRFQIIERAYPFEKERSKVGVILSRLN